MICNIMKGNIMERKVEAIKLGLGLLTIIIDLVVAYFLGCYFLDWWFGGL